MRHLLLPLAGFLGAFSVAQSQNLFEALREGDIVAVKALVEKFPQTLDSADSDGMIALHLARNMETSRC